MKPHHSSIITNSTPVHQQKNQRLLEALTIIIIIGICGIYILLGILFKQIHTTNTKLSPAEASVSADIVDQFTQFVADQHQANKNNAQYINDLAYILRDIEKNQIPYYITNYSTLMVTQKVEYPCWYITEHTNYILVPTNFPVLMKKK